MASNKATPLTIAAKASGIQSGTLRGRMRRGKTLEEAVAMGPPTRPETARQATHGPMESLSNSGFYSDKPMSKPPAWMADPALLPKAPPRRVAS